MSSSSIRRGTLAATALALSLAALTACGAGNNAETLKINPDNARVTAGSIKIQNAVVITPADEADGPAAVSARIFNNGDRDQTLERLTLADGGQELELSGANGRGGVVVPAGGSVMLGGEGHASAVLPDGHDAGHGATKKLAFEFSREGEVRLAAFIVADDGEYAPWAATPTPTPVETGTSSPDAEPGEDAGTGTDATEGAEGGAAGADATDGASPDADATENAVEGTDATEGATSSESPVTEQ